MTIMLKFINISGGAVQKWRTHEDMASVQDVPKLSDHYKTFQKIYVCTAAALLCWRLFGITLDTSRFGFTLKGQEAVAYVLVSGLVYLGYKVTIEWRECDQLCRKLFTSRLDFVVTHGIAMFALGLLAQQFILRSKLGSVAADHGQWLTFFALVSTTGSSFCFLWYTKQSTRSMKIIGALSLIAMLSLSIILLVYTAFIIGPISSIAILVVGLLPATIVVMAKLLFMLLLGLFVSLMAASSKSDKSENQATR